MFFMLLEAQTYGQPLKPAHIGGLDHSLRKKGKLSTLLPSELNSLTVAMPELSLGFALPDRDREAQLWGPVPLSHGVEGCEIKRTL